MTIDKYNTTLQTLLYHNQKHDTSQSNAYKIYVQQVLSIKVVKVVNSSKMMSLQITSFSLQILLVSICSAYN